MSVNDYWELQTGRMGYANESKKDLVGNFFSAKGCRVVRMEYDQENDTAGSITISADYILIDTMKMVVSKRIRKLN
jgi:hypothetical protein